MSIKEILVIVAFCVVTVSYTVTALLSYFRGKKAKADPEQVNAEFSNIAAKALELIFAVEGSYSSLPKGGALKSKDVLNDIKDMCEEKQLAFDKTYWTNFVNASVDLINFKRKSEEKSSETTTEA